MNNDLTKRERFSAFVLEHGDEALGLAKFLAPGAADDVMQEAYLRLWNESDAFDLKELRLKLCNSASNGGRKERRVKAREQVVAKSRKESDMENDPAVRALEADEIAKLERLLSQVPTKPRMAMVLRYREGLCDSEIGSHLGVSEDSAYRLVAEGRAKLRSAWVRAGLAIPVSGPELMLARPSSTVLPAALKVKLLAIPLSGALASSSAVVGGSALRTTLAAAGVLGAVALGIALNSDSSTPVPSLPVMSSADTSSPTRVAEVRQQERASGYAGTLVARNTVATATPVDAPEKTFSLPLVVPPATEEEATEALALLRAIRSLQGKGADARRRYLAASRHPRHVAELEFGRQAYPAAARAYLYEVVANAVVVDVGRFPEDSPMLRLLASVLTSAPDDCPEEVRDSSALRLLVRHIAATAPAGSLNRASAVAILGGIGTSEDAVQLASNRDELGIPSRRTLTSVSVSHVLTRTAALGLSTLSQGQFAELEQAVSCSGNVAENVSAGSLLSSRRWGAVQAEEEIVIARASSQDSAIAGIDFRQQPAVGFGCAIRVSHREAEADFEAYNFRCLACPGHSELLVHLYSEKPFVPSMVALHCVAADRPWLPKSDVVVRVSLDGGFWQHDVQIDFAGPHWVRWPVMPACAAGAHTLSVKLLRGTTTFRVKELRLVAAE